MLKANARSLIVTLLLISCFSFPLFAQKTLVNEDDTRIYQRAIELFDKAQYTNAQKHFLLFAASRTADREMRINAEYHAGVCAMELFNPDAIAMLSAIITNYPENPKAKLARFQLGKYFYRSKDNKSSARYMASVDAAALTPEEATEYWFIKGYVNFKTDHFEEARTAFRNIKDQPSRYYDPANYYYGYVAYKQNNYDEALEHFSRIGKSKTFGPLSQVYVSQILFARGGYRQVVSFADTISNREIVNDVAGIVGQSYYNLGEYEKALPFLEKFNAGNSSNRGNADIYRLGFAYLKTGHCPEAISQFTQLADGKDSTAQFANYHLATCFLRAEEGKPAARLAFQKAAATHLNDTITEISVFNFAKLSYELSFQQVALSALALFINGYPHSNYADEAKSMLGNLLLSTKNYKEAIRIIESIRNPGPESQAAFQRVCYYRAEELYLNNDYVAALEMFRKSLQYDFDKKLYALAWFWIGEISYKQGSYENANDAYAKFQTYSEVKETRFFPLAYYNRGYCELKLENYGSAVKAFSSFLATNYVTSAPELYTDASMRLADCYFVTHDYNKAIESYDVIIDKKLNGTDYALYQKAMILGVLNRPAEKIAALEVIKSGYPRSSYIDDAVFEIANVSLQTENFDAAIAGFNNIIVNYPRSMYIRKAMLNKGLAYYNTNKDDQAVESFKALVTSYPKSEEARQALTEIRNIFVNKGESDKYLETVSSLPDVVLSPTYQDSVTYESAFNLYKSGDCAKAAKAFGTYISRFPGGFFILRAHYYEAECDFRNKNNDSALVHYEFVADYNRNDFTERSTRQAAVILFTNRQYERAYGYYSALERIASTGDDLNVALLGQMRSSAALNWTDTAAQSSFRFLNAATTLKEGVKDAHINIARYYVLHDQPDSALSHFQLVIRETKDVYAAESKYNVALIQYGRKEYKAAKKTIFELNDNYSSYEYWTAKGFILLADIYVAEKDLFQAKATLQSIIENYEGEDLKSVASEKLRQIIASESDGRQQGAPAPEKDIE